MSSPKIFFAENIRFLRKRRKLVQEEMAEKLGLARIKLHALESGKTQNPTLNDVILFSEFFKVSVDSLLKVDLQKLGELKLQELLSGHDVYMTGSRIRVLAITVNEKNKENTEYVPIKAKAGYRSGYNDPEYIAALPRFTLPNLPASGTFRMFPTTGDSMLPIPEHSEVIAQYVLDWKSIKPDTPCIVILKGDQDFVFKMVTIRDNQVVLRSLNPRYAPYTVPAEEVLEIWAYIKHQTGTLPEPQTEISELKSIILNLQQKMMDWKNGA